jgi:hypothetical protein
MLYLFIVVEDESAIRHKAKSKREQRMVELSGILKCFVISFTCYSKVKQFSFIDESNTQGPKKILMKLKT